MSSDESDTFDEEESDKLGSEYGSNGTFSIGLFRLLLGVGFPLDFPLYAYESCDGDGGTTAVPRKNTGEAGTGEGVRTKCTSDDNIFSIAQILSESYIDPMFVVLAGTGWFESVLFGSIWIDPESLLFKITEFLRPTFQF